MDKEKLIRACFKAGRYLKKAAPTIMTCVSAAGVVATAVLAAKGALKAKRLIDETAEEKGAELTKTETVLTAAPAYIPACVVGASTVACLFGANILGKRQRAAAIAACVSAHKALAEYQNKVKETLGEDGEKEIRDAIAKDACAEYEGDIPKGEILFYLPVCDADKRYFTRTIEEVQNAEYHLNRNFILRGYANLNEFYDFLGLDKTKSGGELGWSDEAGFEFYGYQWIDFEHKFKTLDDGRELCVIHMPFPPTYDFMSFGE